MSTKIIADRLREARVYLGFNRDDVSGAMGRERRWVDDIEHGRRQVTGEELRKLARLYRRPVAWLCGESSFQPSPDMLRQVENLTEHDREAVLDFAEFLEGAGPAPEVRRCKHCKKPVIRCESVPVHIGCSSGRGFVHAGTRAHGGEPRSGGPYAEPAVRAQLSEDGNGAV